MSSSWDDASARSFLKDVFQAAVSRANPAAVLAAKLPEKPKGRCIVVGAGKASAAMAAALDAAWPDVDVSGIVVTRYGHSVPAGRINVIEAGHPVPDQNSERAALDMMSMVRGLGANDLVIALISGGGSSLLCLPRQGMDLTDKAEVHRVLLRSGASIAEMNVLRSQLSDIKDGRLAAEAHPAQIVTLVISDIPGDDPAMIASGPTVASQIQQCAARKVVDQYKLDLPPSAAILLDVARPNVQTTPSDVRLIATPMDSLLAAAAAATSKGVTPLILGDAIQGESREAGKLMAAIAKSVKKHGSPLRPPAVLLSGGETSVTLGDARSGKGGRNTEFLLSLAIALSGVPGIWALAGDTDGIDGSEEAAGAIVTPDTIARARKRDLDANGYLKAFDSYSFFHALGDLVITGPTLTNVNDIRAILIT